MNLKWFWILICLNLCQARRQKRFIFGKDGCETLIKCLAAGNVIFPYRLNFNPITAYDRITSHIHGRNGWRRGQIRNFEKQRNKISRLKRRQEMRRVLHRQKVQFWRKRHQQMTEKMEDFQQTNVTYY